MDPMARWQLCLSQSPLVPLGMGQHQGHCDPPRALAGTAACIQGRCCLRGWLCLGTLSQAIQVGQGWKSSPN